MSRVDDRKIKYRLKVDCTVKASSLKQAMDAFYVQAMEQIKAEPGRDNVSMNLFLDTDSTKPVLHGQFNLFPVAHNLTIETMGMRQ